ncbi:MAG: ArsR family transcriptional regulator, partial [Xanthobacteraceae bacterium]
LRDEHAHRRLGFPRDVVTQWLEQAGLDMVRFDNLPPEPNSEGKIAVSLWLARDPRLAMAHSEMEVA